MGNENSRLKGLIVEKDAVVTNDFYILYNAETTKTSATKNEEGRLEKLSVFQGERAEGLWGPHGPLKHAVKNLMIYRHPHILKFITTWTHGQKVFLATERVCPLIGVLETFSSIQICLGLRTILCGLIFLNEKALARHLNICTNSIYISETGSWRLAGFEYVWKASEVKKALLESLEKHRHNPAIDPKELKSDENMNTIEQYAFAALCVETINKSTAKVIDPDEDDCETPHVAEFREYCTTVLQHKNPEMRPKLAAILLHPYFNHELISIHSFLFELPLKSMPEKQSFFTSLVDRLRYFNENVVAAQFSSDLLSRMVLLDPTAQLCVTPYVLNTKSVNNTAALFSRDSYQRYVMPHIRKMFRLRDAQIRLILLEYFMEYVRLMTKEELKEFLLPHLQVGMNDSNDILVAKTLRCMADLIPVLGATEVLGERVRLFSDGRPQAAVSSETTHWIEPRSITPVLSGSGAGKLSNDGNDDNMEFMVSGSPLPDNIDIVSESIKSLVQSEFSSPIPCEEMPPRLSPDGGEDDKTIVLTDCTMNGSTVDISITNSISKDKSSPSNHNSIVHAADVIADNIQDAFDSEANDADGAWSDWEAEDELHLKEEKILNLIDNDNQLPVENIVSAMSKTLHSNSSKAEMATSRVNSKIINDDLAALDIQIQKATIKSTQTKQDDFDFFKDMEPVFKSPSILSIVDTRQNSHQDDEEVLIDTNRFAANMHHESDVTLNATKDHSEGDGWDMDDADDDTTYLQASA